MKYPLILAITLLLVACTKPEKPTFKKLENIKFNSLSIKKPYSVKLNADAIFNNPNSVGAKITAMDFDVFINGIKTTHIKQDVATKILAQSDFTLPIICTVPLKDIFKDLKITDLLKSQKIQYQMTGYLTINLAGVPVKVPFDVEGEEKLRL